jgi:hypothetical protein
LSREEMMSTNHKSEPNSEMTPSNEHLPEKLKLSEARRYLNISFSKMTGLVSNGTIPWEADPFDSRVKLVKRADLDSLIRKRG